MARSSGGGSRSGGSSGGGGSRSSGGGRRSHSSGRGIVTRRDPFPGCRKFRYYRDGMYHYVYSDTDLTREKDVKPRWFFVLFYIPFILAIISMWANSIRLPEKPLSVQSSAFVAVFDEADVLTTAEESSLLMKLDEFHEATGITAQVITVTRDEWSNLDTLEEYAYYRYYAQFEDEAGWLLVYSEENGGYGEWYWEGIQGDETIKVMDVFLSDYNTTLHSSLMKKDAPDVADSFEKAFSEAIRLFKNQNIRIEWGLLAGAAFTTLFITFHAGVMIFAGTNRKYSYGELEEVYNTEGYMMGMEVTCPYCGVRYTFTGEESCPFCRETIG